MPHSGLIIVAPAGDALSSEVEKNLALRESPVVRYLPSELGSLPAELNETEFVIEDDIVVQAVLWRVSPSMCLADDFAEADRRFADVETAATWLAALQLPGIVAVNRFDADSWYSGLHWDYWRGRLRAAGIETAPLIIGDYPVPESWQWNPYFAEIQCETPDINVRSTIACACRAVTPVLENICVCGTVVGDVAHPMVHRAAHLLNEWGVGLARVSSDHEGHLHYVNVLPGLEEMPLLEHVADGLGNHFHEHCFGR